MTHHQPEQHNPATQGRTTLKYPDPLWTATLLAHAMNEVPPKTAAWENLMILTDRLDTVSRKASWNKKYLYDLTVVYVAIATQYIACYTRMADGWCNECQGLAHRFSALQTTALTIHKRHNPDMHRYILCLINDMARRARCEYNPWCVEPDYDPINDVP